MIESKAQFDETYRLLKGDLATLFKLVFRHNTPVVEADIRLASVILRKWLLNNLLSELAQAARTRPTLFALDNAAVFAEIPNQPSINYFLTGGVKFDGTAVQGIYNSSIPSNGRPLVPVETMTFREFSLGEFKRQKRLYFDGVFFSCEDIIRYVCNKLGGAHYELGEPGRIAKLDQAAAFMKFGGPLPYDHPPPSHMYMCLEGKGSEVLTGLHIEVCAAASSLCQVRFDGEPIMQFQTKKSWRRWLMEKLRRTDQRAVQIDY